MTRKEENGHEGTEGNGIGPQDEYARPRGASPP